MENKIKRSDMLNEIMYSKALKKYKQTLWILIILNIITFKLFEKRFNYQGYLAGILMNKIIGESLK